MNICPLSFQFLSVLRERMEKREAEKLVKHVIKSAVKLGVLRRHGQLSAADERALAAFRSKFHVSTLQVTTQTYKWLQIK